MQAQGGVCSSRQLMAAGVSATHVERLVRHGALVRPRRGALILGSVWKDAAPWQAQALRARAIGHSLAWADTRHSRAGGGADVESSRAGGGAADGLDPAGSCPVAAGRDGSGADDINRFVTRFLTSGEGDHRQGHPACHTLSHQSALMIHGLPTFGDVTVVHLCRTDGVRGRRQQEIFVHQPIDEEWVEVVDGIRVVVPVMAALQVAAADGVEAGVVCLDGVLRRAEELDRDTVGRRHGPARAEVDRQIARALQQGFPNAQRLVQQVVDQADGRSESVGESRSRCLLHTLGLGPCIPQFVVRDGSVVIGRVDLKLEGWPVLIEFDGKGKYVEQQVLLEEKRREDALRALGYEVVRLTWSDLERPGLVKRKVLAALARAQARMASNG